MSRPRREPDHPCGCTRMVRGGPCPGRDHPDVVEPERSDEAHPDSVPVSQSVSVPPLTPNPYLGESRCITCGAPIRWCVTEAGRRMPINLQPDPERGNVIVTQAGVGKVLGLAEAIEARRLGVRVFLPHFATPPRRCGVSAQGVQP